MFQTDSLQKYVKLLSVYLFAVMEEGEALLLQTYTLAERPLGKHPCDKHSVVEGVVVTSSFLEKTQLAKDWLLILTKLDAHLSSKEIPLLALEPLLILENELRDEKMVRSSIEDLVNSAALTLMLLDDHYKVFGLETKSFRSSFMPQTSFIPVLQIQDIKPDSDLSKPRPA